VKKLSLASLQTEKTKKESSSRQLARGKTKFVKDKNTFANTSYYRYKGHVASNNLSDADTKSSSPNLSELDKNKVEEVAAHFQDLGKVPPSL
jgi:hypothetical protein